MKKKYIMISILLSIVILLTGTYAWLTWRSQSSTAFTFHLGDLADVIITNNNDTLTGNNLGPVLSKEEGLLMEFQVLKKTEDPFTITIDFLPIILPEELKEESFKYVLYRKTNETEDYSYVTEGNFLDKVEGTQFTITKEDLTQTTYYQLFIYIDGNMSNPSDMQGQNFEGKLIVRYETKKDSLSTFITSLYTSASKTTVTNNGINYEYAQEVSMMKDVGGNIRYYGADPDNYIYFNCSDYHNQDDTTCEKWRIIGIFDEKLKIMRNEIIGAYSWDTLLDTNIHSEYEYGINQWGPSTYTDGKVYEGADLMKLLNPGYEQNQDRDSSWNMITVNNSLYYNAQSGNCFNYKYNGYTTCNFQKTGLKNEKTRNLISETVYYLGGLNSSSDVYSDQAYRFERGTITVSSPSDNVKRTVEWEGKVALPYVSDYGYAADLSQCKVRINSYSDSACKDNNWMKPIFTSGYNWFITPHSNYSYSVWIVRAAADTNDSSLEYSGGVVPTLHLDPNIVINQEIGTGDINNPYQIVLN